MDGRRLVDPSSSRGSNGRTGGQLTCAEYRVDPLSQMRRLLRRVIAVASCCVVAMMFLFPPWTQELYSVTDPKGLSPDDVRLLTHSELLDRFGGTPTPPKVFRRSIFYPPRDDQSSAAEGGTV